MADEREVIEDEDADTRDVMEGERNEGESVSFDIQKAINDIMQRIDSLSSELDAKLDTVTSKMAGISVASGAVIRDAEESIEDDAPALDFEDMDLDI